MNKRRSIIVLGLLFFSILFLMTIVIDVVIGMRAKKENSPIKWTADLDGWSEDKIPIGTMNHFFDELEHIPNDPSRLTLYNQETLMTFLDNKTDIALPHGQVVQIANPISLLDLHEQFPVEWICREENDIKTGRDCIRVIYKVQNYEGNIAYISVFFQDMNSNSYLSIDENGSIENQIETDEFGHIVKKRIDNEWERWMAYGDYIVNVDED